MTKEYPSGDGVLQVLKGINLEIYKNEFVVILGESGCGKSTMMNIVGGMDNMTSGQLLIEGRDFSHPSDAELTRFRREYVGFIFQAYNLMPNLTALDNCFMKAEIMVDRPENADRFDRKYESAVDAVAARLDALAGRRASIRDDEIKGRIQSRLDDAQSELDDSLGKLRQARADLDKGWSTLGEGETQIEEKTTELTDARAKLETSWAQLQDAAIQLEEGKKQLDEAEAKLASGRGALRKGRKQLDAGREELIKTWNQLEDAKAKVRRTIRSRLGKAGKHLILIST